MSAIAGAGGRSEGVGLLGLLLNKVFRGRAESDLELIDIDALALSAMDPPDGVVQPDASGPRHVDPGPWESRLGATLEALYSGLAHKLANWVLRFAEGQTTLIVPKLPDAGEGIRTAINDYQNIWTFLGGQFV